MSLPARWRSLRRADACVSKERGWGQPAWSRAGRRTAAAAVVSGPLFPAAAGTSSGRRRGRCPKARGGTPRPAPAAPSVSRPGPAPLCCLETSAPAARRVARGEPRTNGALPWRSPGGSPPDERPGMWPSEARSPFGAPTPRKKRVALSLGSGAFFHRLKSSPLGFGGLGSG